MSEILHTYPLGHGDHKNILFFEIGHHGGKLFTNKWVKLEGNRLRGAPEENSNLSKSYEIFRLG